MRRSRIRILSQEGNSLASYLLPVIEDPLRLDRYLAACQIGITISSLILGAYGQSTVAVYLASLMKTFLSMDYIAALSISSIGVLLCLMVMHVVLGELVPKSIALQYPTEVALFTVRPMMWSLVIFSWFIKILNGSSQVLLKILGRKQILHRHIHSPEEIDLLIAESRDGGLLEPDEHKRLQKALWLSKISAGELMIPLIHIKAISIETPVAEMFRIVLESPYTRLPVYSGSVDNIIGILHTKDFMKYYLKDRNLKTIEKIMKPVCFIPSTVRSDRILSILREKQSHQAVVVNDSGCVAGILTLEDVLRELVGEITDNVSKKAGRLKDKTSRFPSSIRGESSSRGG